MKKDKIVKIKGADGEWFKEVIFIIPNKESSKYMNNDLLGKANMLIGNYAKKQGLSNKAKQNTDKIINIILITSIMCLVFICIMLI